MNITQSEIQKLSDDEMWNLIDNLLDLARARMRNQVKVTKQIIDRLELELPRSNY